MMIRNVRLSRSGKLIRYESDRGRMPLRGNNESDKEGPLTEWILVKDKDGLRELGLVGPSPLITANLDLRAFKSGRFEWPDELGWKNLTIAGNLIGNEISLGGSDTSVSIKENLSANILNGTRLEVDHALWANVISVEYISAGMIFAKDILGGTLETLLLHVYNMQNCATTKPIAIMSSISEADVHAHYCDDKRLLPVELEIAATIGLCE
jgi:hypothetical protein